MLVLVVRAHHQGMAVDYAARQQRRKARLGKANDLNGRACDQNLGLRCGPKYPVDQVVRPIGIVADPVAVEIEGRIVAPVIAAAIFGPVEIPGADIFDLVSIVDEGVVGQCIALGTRREVNADRATLKDIAAEAVLVGVVDEDAFFRPQSDGRPLGKRVLRGRQPVFGFSLAPPFAIHRSEFEAARVRRFR